MTTQVKQLSINSVVPLYLLGGTISAGWAVIFYLYFATSSIILALGLYTFAGGIAMVLLQRERLREWLAFSWFEIGLGVLAGLGMAALTYLVYPVAVSLFPELAPEVKALYQKLLSGVGPVRMLHWMVLVMVMEEIIFRGLFMTPLEEEENPPFSIFALLLQWKAWRRVLFATLIYTFVHLGSGSLLLCLLTASCGIAWGWMRLWRGSLVMVIVCHVVWDMFVFILYPLA